MLFRSNRPGGHPELAREAADGEGRGAESGDDLAATTQRGRRESTVVVAASLGSPGRVVEGVGIGHIAIYPTGRLGARVPGGVWADRG